MSTTENAAKPIRTLTQDEMRAMGLKPVKKARPRTDKQIAADDAKKARAILKADAQLPPGLREFWAGSVSASVLADVASGNMKIERA